LDARSLDLALARAWPAADEVAVGPWVARLDGGVTRRANSLLPLGVGAEPAVHDLDAWLSEAEGLYRARGLTPWIQIVPSVWPSALGRHLAAAGWETGIGPTLVLAGPLPESRGGHAVQLDDDPTPDWIGTWWSVDPRGGAAELTVARGILDRIRVERAFARALDREGRCVGTALGALVEGLLVLECVATRPDARRQGVARAALGGLGAWAAARGGSAAVLAVQAGNAAAVALYRALGLERHGVYSYARP
jgi:ribosomal protein S18 acetylase RimI-like enzyme